MVTKIGCRYVNVGGVKCWDLPNPDRPAFNIEHDTRAVDVTKALGDAVGFVLEEFVLLQEVLEVFQPEVGNTLLFISPRAAEQYFFFVLRDL